MKNNAINHSIREFLKLESAGGILLMGAALLAMLVENLPPLKPLYDALLSTPVEIRFEIRGARNPRRSGPGIVYPHAG